MASTPKHTVIDEITDIFIHNGWGTGMVGVNHGPRNPASSTESTQLSSPSPIGSSVVEIRELLNPLSLLK